MTCTECRAVIAAHLNDPPGDPCARCAANQIEGHPPKRLGGPPAFEEDPWSTDAQLA